jgi:hypothetical protein
LTTASSARAGAMTVSSDPIGSSTPLAISVP